jgi:excisionase family DNA binding protein
MSEQSPWLVSSKAREVAARARAFADALDALASDIARLDIQTDRATRLPSREVPLQTASDGLWNAGEVAKFLKVSLSWVYKESQSGRLPTRRVGALIRFSPDAIRSYSRSPGSPAHPTRR